MSALIQTKQISLAKGAIHRDYLPVGPSNTSSRLFEIEAGPIITKDSTVLTIQTGSVFFKALHRNPDELGLSEVPFIQVETDGPRVFLVPLRIGEFVYIRKAPESPGDSVTEETVIEYELIEITGDRAIFEVRHKGFTYD